MTKAKLIIKEIIVVLTLMLVLTIGFLGYAIQFTYDTVTAYIIGGVMTWVVNIPAALWWLNKLFGSKQKSEIEKL